MWHYRDTADWNRFLSLQTRQNAKLHFFWTSLEEKDWLERIGDKSQGTCVVTFLLRFNSIRNNLEPCPEFTFQRKIFKESSLSRFPALLSNRREPGISQPVFRFSAPFTEPHYSLLISRGETIQAVSPRGVLHIPMASSTHDRPWLWSLCLRFQTLTQGLDSSP